MSEPPEDDLPAFTNPFADATAEERVYAVMLQTRDPAPARDIAERADCDQKTARKYLDWFERLGIVTKHEGNPDTFVRNDSYVEWRRVDELARTHSLEDLRVRASELNTRIDAYREEYGVEHPNEVDTLTRTGEAQEDAWADVADWASTLEELRRCERARQVVTESSTRARS